MSKRFGILMLLFSVFASAFAQQKWNYPEVDKKSYDLYLQQNWNELIDFANESRKNGIDFFYLEARTGIAYYNLKKYSIAARYFRQAWENDKSQEWLQEYLYFSLVLSGQSIEASKIADSFTPGLKEKIGYRRHKVLYTAFEGGYSFDSDYDKLLENTFNEDLNIGDDYGEAFFLKDYYFGSFDLIHQIAPGAGIYHNFTYININREQQVDWGGRSSFPINTNQYQYFINPYFMVGKKVVLSPSLNLTWGNSFYYLGTYRGTNPAFVKMNYNFSDFIFSLNGSSRFGNFGTGIEIDFASINNQNLSQYSAWVTFYLLSNTNLYVTPRVYFKNDSQNGFGYNTFGISGGAQLGPVHFYGQYLNGNMINFIESGGYVISNFPGRSTQKIMGTLYFPTGKKYRFVVRYINQNIFEKYNVYTNEIMSNSLEYKYIKQTITAGISWNF